MNFNERSELLFKKLMSMYLNDGKPVGSTALAKLPEVGVSSATVRNVMADLERMGLIHSPHTSAGRIPTDLGFRVFVDTILTVQPLNQTVQQNIQQGFQRAQTQDELIGSASNILSSLTGMASLVMLPNKEQEVLRHIDFVRLGERRLLVVLVLNDNDVQNRIIELEESASESELLEVANYLNQHFVGHSLRDVKQKLVRQMDEIRLNMNRLMRAIMDAADQVIDAKTQTAAPYFISGKTNLLNYQELADTDKLKALFQSFEQHTHMLNLLDKSMQAKGVQVFIGNECGHEIYQNCSIVTTPYDVDGEVVGVLGVVGPSRMHYDHVVPRVDMTAKILSSLLRGNR
ncbi:MAG: heat-inducible transcription repressor HrcA [Thiotrichales bacterium]|nr:heat-inducible transcription repressor HrcA [Thiotrichales bacterium]